MKGGKLYGEGENGALFGNPRLPCDDEKMSDLKPNEVSKIILEYHPYSLYRDIVIEEIEKKFPNKRKLLQYFLLPKKQCETKDANELDTENIYNKAWLDNNNTIDIKDDEFVFKKNAYKLKSKFVYQSIFEKADKTLDTLVDNLETTQQASQLLYKVIELYEGLSYIHLHDFYHNDIKMDNIMSIQNRLKFIDTDLFIGKTVYDDVLIQISKNLFYIGYSPIIIYCNFGLVEYGKNSIYSISLKELFLNEDLLDDIAITYCKHLLSNFKNIFSSVKHSGLNATQKEAMFGILNRVLNMYMYGLVENPAYRIETSDTVKDIDVKLSRMISFWEKVVQQSEYARKNGFNEEEVLRENPDVRYIMTFFERYNEKILQRDVYEKIQFKRVHKHSWIDSYFAISNDMFGYLFMLLQMSAVLFNEKYGELHSHLFDVVMTASRLMIESIDRRINEPNEFIKQSRMLLRNVRDGLVEDEMRTCRGTMCTVMGGRKTRHKKQSIKRRKTRRGRKY
jgi:serine/threonine protein kinase